MKREAVLHIPMSNYAHGLDEKHVLFRLRSAREDLTSCRLFYGDRACRLTPVIFSSIRMEVVAQDEYFDYYEVILNSPYTRICYYFELKDQKETILYYSDLFEQNTVADRSYYYQFPYNRREDIASIPEWTKDAIIYNIFPDSFATSYRYISGTGTEVRYQGNITKGKLGGTIRGITENVDYLMELGVNCIYINPFFVAGEYHKYDLLDYFHVDPCFGTDEEFKHMVTLYHENGIRVIIDGVFNHCGWKFFAFEDVVHQGQASRYKDWFYRLEFPVIRPDNMEDIPNYECFGYERLMPKLNTSNQEVIQYFCKVCNYWLTEYDVDGWRLDVANEVNDDFWREFRKSAKKAKPDCFIIGEVWESATHWLKGDQFDSSMNYDFRKHCKAFFAEGKLDAFGFDSRVTQMRMRYHKNLLYGQLNLLDSHDVSRFLSLCQENINRFKLAILFQMTFIGPPSIFYGDEQQIAGMLEEDYRSPMRWELGNPMFDFYQKAIRLRREQEVLRRGEYRTISANKGSKLYVFQRYIEQEGLIIGVNAGPEEVLFDLCSYKKQGLSRNTGSIVECMEGFSQDNNSSMLPALKQLQVLWQEGFDGSVLSGYGFVVLKEESYGSDN